MFAKRETHSAHIGNGKIRNPKTNSPKGQPSRMMVHAKLEMTEPSDNEEREADLMADAIVSGGKISRAVEGNASQGGVAVPKGMENQLNQCQGGGRAMPDGLRSMMETGFGQDFSTVRLHTDNQAAEMSSAIHARAFTYGNNIFFNQGQYSPDTPAGQRLIAHELTHVVQGEGKVARKVNEEICENIDLIDEEQVAWSKSLSNGLSGFNADNVAMIHLIETLRSKIIIILNQKEAILKISESDIMTSDLGLPDVSLKDIEDIEEARASIFNNVKIAIENSKKGKAYAKNALNDAISEFQAMGEVLTILSENYEEIITNLYQLKANLEEELKKAATKLYFEIIDRRNLIKVKFQKVQYGWELLRETKDNAYWYVRWTAAPSDSKLDNIKSSINNVANGANAIESFYTRYKDKIDESKGSQFESFKELSEWAKFFNDKANEVGPKLYEIDCKISDLRNDHISSAENWATGLKITSEIAITVSSCFIPGGAAAKLAVWGSKAYKASKLVNSIANLKKFKIPERIATVPKVIEKLSHTFTNKTLHFINKNNITKVSASLVKEASLNITGTGIETLSKLSSNVTSNWLFEEDVYKLPEGKDWLKSGLSGAFVGSGMGIFRYFKISQLAKKGVSEGAENVTNNSKIIDKIIDKFSVEGLANSGFAFLGDKIAEGVVDDKVTSPSLTDLTYLIGAFNFRKPQFRTKIISKELDQVEVDLYKRNKLDAIDKKIAKRDKLNEEKIGLETEKTKLENEKTVLEKAKLENEQKELVTKKRELETDKKLETEKTKLENEKTKLENDKTKLVTEKTGLETDKTKLVTEKTGLETEKTKLENDKKLETKKTELENEKTELKNEKTKLKATFGAFNIYYTNMTNLKNIVNSFYKRINPTNEFKDLDNFIKNLDEKKNKLNDKICELDDKIKQKGNEIDKLEANIKQKGEEIDKLEANIKQKGVEIRDLDANIKQKGADIRELDAKIEQKGIDISELEAKITKKEADIGELEAKIEQKGVDIRELEANIKQKGVDIRELEANIKQKGVDIRELEANIKQKGVEIDKLDAKITKKEVEIGKLDAKIKETRGSDKSIDDIKSEIKEEKDKLILENLYKSKYEKKYNIDNYGITSEKWKWKLFPDKDYDMENYNHFDIQEGLISKFFYKNKDRFDSLSSSEEKAEEKKEEYIPIQKQFFTKEKYREGGKMKRFYVFFTSESTEINKQEDIDKIADSIQERKMNKNAIINIRIIGQASHKWLTKKSDEHGKKLNEELANKRADIVKETLFNKLLERHITHNEIDSTINIETMVSIADYDTANEIENNANLANLRSVIVEINTQ